MNRWRELRLKRQAQHRGGPFSELSARAFNVLDQLGIHTVDALRRATDNDLLRARSCGKVTVREIREWLAKQPQVDGFTPGVKPDSAVAELRDKILVTIRRTSPRWNVTEIDHLLAEFADGLIDRERDIWQRARRPILDASALIEDISPRNGPGELQIGANDKGEVVINLPRDMTGHICFTPAQARHLAVVLIRQAAAAANEPLPGGFGS